MVEQNIEEQSVADDGVYQLIRPINFEGEEIKSLNLDFDDLGGNDLMGCAKLAQRLDPNEVPVLRAASINYQVAVAARAAGVVPELIMALKAKDFTIVTQKAANFLVLQE